MTTTITDPVREHVRRVLEASLSHTQACLQRVEDLERAGYRIVGGGQTDTDTWEVTDWHTDQILVEGGGGLDGYDAATEHRRRLHPDEKWFHCDHLGNDELPAEVETPGVPLSLGECLTDWVEGLHTTDEEIADFVGWSVEKVRQAQRRGLEGAGDTR